MDAHTAVGRRLGITDEDIDQLIDLKPDDFERREWLVLKYTQDWIFCNGQEHKADYITEYKSEFSDLDQRCVLKLLSMMRFANQFNNTFFKKQWRNDLGTSGGSCQLPVNPEQRTGS